MPKIKLTVDLIEKTRSKDNKNQMNLLKNALKNFPKEFLVLKSSILMIKKY